MEHAEVNWYLIRSKVRQERRAMSQLMQQGHTVYCPEIMVNTSKSLIVKNQLQPLFPGYIFIQLNRKDTNWNAIKSTRGVYGFVQFGQEAAIVHDDIVERVRQQIEQDDFSSERTSSLSLGDRVRVTGGCFEGLDAIFQYRSGADRAVVLISIMGRMNEANVKAVALEAVDSNFGGSL